jgi:hypothetical protein
MKERGGWGNSRSLSYLEGERMGAKKGEGREREGRGWEGGRESI